MWVCVGKSVAFAQEQYGILWPIWVAIVIDININDIAVLSF
jgi:hypothetical protein